MSTNNVYNPTTSNILNKLDTLIKYAEIVKKLEPIIKEQNGLVDTNNILKDAQNNNNQELVDSIKEYIEIKTKFENMEKEFLVETARTLGFEGREFMIKPLKDLIDKIKKAEATPQYALQQMIKLVKTLGINKLLNNVEAVPYVGQVSSAIMKNLDNFTEAQPVIEKIVDLMTAIGVNKSDVEFINNYTRDNYITSNYKKFQNTLAEGDLIKMDSTSNSINSFVIRLKKTLHYFFNGPENNNTIGGNRSQPKNINRKTKREINNINKTIKSHLLRLRRTSGNPFNKSVASGKIKGGI
jgi:hypothetical protein